MHGSGGMGGGHHGGDFGGHHGGHGGHMSSGGPDSQPGMFFPAADYRQHDPLDPWRRRGSGVRRYRGPAFVVALVFRLAILAFIIFVAIQVFHAR